MSMEINTGSSEEELLLFSVRKISVETKMGALASSNEFEKEFKLPTPSISIVTALVH